MVKNNNNKKDSITSIINSSTRYRLPQTCKQISTSRNHKEIRKNRKIRKTILKQYPKNNFTDKQHPRLR